MRDSRANARPAGFRASGLARFGASGLARFGASTLARFGASTLARFGASTLARFGASTLALAGGVLLAACSLSGCLIANQFDFPVDERPPTARPFAPQSFTHVPTFADSNCLGSPTDSLQFLSIITEPNPGNRVFANYFVNNQSVPGFSAQELSPTGADPEQRTFARCLPHSALSSPCNRVQLVVSLELARVEPVTGVQNERTSVLEWFVLGKAASNADAVPSDCTRWLQSDAGTPPRPDGSVPPPDGGPVASDAGQGAPDGGFVASDAGLAELGARSADGGS